MLHDAPDAHDDPIMHMMHMMHMISLGISGYLWDLGPPFFSFEVHTQ